MTQADVQTLDTQELRKAFGTFLTGVTVVTTTNNDGGPVGFTANSYTSVSLDPPLVLVCPALTLKTIDTFMTCHHFVINILAEGQQDVSTTFSCIGDDRFSQVSWHQNQWRMPILDSVVSHFSCSVHDRIIAGDHLVLIGQVQEFQTTDTPALGYLKGNYLNLEMERRAEQLASSNPDMVVGAIVAWNNQVLLIKTPQGYQLPHIKLSKKQNAQSAIRQLLVDQQLDGNVGSVYSIFDDQESNTTFSFYLTEAKNGTTSGFGEYVSINRLNTIQFFSKALQEMMLRYSLDRKNCIFGLYVGNQSRGDIHPLHGMT